MKALEKLYHTLFKNVRGQRLVPLILSIFISMTVLDVCINIGGLYEIFDILNAVDRRRVDIRCNAFAKTRKDLS